jgi:hypothetical protein
LPISAIIAVGQIGVGHWLMRRARVYADAADWATSKNRDEMAIDLNDWAIGCYKLATLSYFASLGLTLGHILWPHL